MPSERSFEELLQITQFADELPVAIWVGRVPSGECVYVNRAFREVLGIDPPADAARGNYVGPYSVHTLNGERYPESEMPYERALAARALIEIDDMFLLRHDGERTYLRVYARPLFDSGGEISHILEAFTDITREVLSKKVQREQETQLRMAQRMESLGSLAGGIAHDFNNLLTIIKLVVTQLAVHPEAGTRVREGLAQIDEMAESAARLTRSLLGFARQGKSLKQAVSMVDVTTRVVELMQRGLGRQISIVTEHALPRLDVEGDPTQLEQLLMNLLFNAKDAIPGAGKITVRTSQRDIGPQDCTEVTPGRYAVIEVEDTGTGIPSSVRDRIFEPYFTTKTVGAVKGTGLGLATVFGIVESHHGHASIVRTGENGTTMRVLLPVSSTNTPGVESQPAQRAPSEPTEDQEKRGTVLVVDDEPLVLRVTSRSLRELGYDVLTASDGASALEAFRSANGSVDAVVLDLVMPIMSGRETFIALRELDPQLQVVLITGYALNDEAQALLNLGARTLVPKPFSIADLSTALAGIMRERARGRA